MTEHFDNQKTLLDSPADRIVSVTANDSTDLPDGPCRALLVGGAGAATVHDNKGQVATLIPLQAGYNPIRVQRVLLTGLVATDIWALY